jgi:hypothetical protein
MWHTQTERLNFRRDEAQAVLDSIDRGASFHSFAKDELVKLASRLIVEEALEGEASWAPRHRAEFFGPSPAIPKPSIDSFGTSEETIVAAVPFRDVDSAVIANRRM